MEGDKDGLSVIIYGHSSKQRLYTNPINLLFKPKVLSPVHV